MDDLSQQLTGQRVLSPTEEAWHAEQRRRQYDIIRVSNPLNEDFFVEYDTNQFQKIPAGTTRDIPRYIAERYCKHMTNKIIHDMSQRMHDDTVKERAAKGFPAYKSKFEENEETYNAADYPKTNDPKIADPIWNQLWVGLVSEVGRDVPPEIATKYSNEINRDPFDVQQLKRLQNKRVDDTVPTPVTSQGLSPNIGSFDPNQDVPQPEFVEHSKIDFSALNESLDKKVTEDEVTQ